MNAVLTAALVILTVAVVFILIQMFRTLGNLNRLISDLGREVPPILSKLQRTVDEVNVELGRVDEIARTVQEVTDKVQVTMEVAQEVVSSPLIKLASLSAGTKKAWSSLVGKGPR